MNRRRFIKRSMIAAPFGVGAIAGYGRFLERHQLEVTETRVAVGLQHPLKIGILGDIHFDPLFEADYLRSCVRTANSLKPDMLVFTGDFVSHSLDGMSDLAKILAEARAPLGVFAILGNHDHWIAPDRVTDSLTRVGIHVLRNESVPMPKNDLWYLTGLESYWAGNPTTISIAATPAHSRHLLLVHEPDPFDLLDDDRIAIQLSGHTHGGQIRVPGWGALELPSWGRRYQMGWYRRQNRMLYVNRGVGTVDHHYRVNCRPEITFLDLS